MTLISRLFSLCEKKIIFGRLRMFSTWLEKELNVPTFCDIHVDLPYNVNVKPLNVHKYHNCDQLIIQQDGQSLGDTLKCFVDGNHVQIKDVNNTNSSIVCNIRAPMKSNLYIHSSGDISVGYFNGDRIFLESHGGNISLRKYQGNSIELIANYGDINLSESVLARSIEASISGKGSISCGKLQGSILKLRTNEGNIAVESSYCDQSEFKIDRGNLDLCNAHKNCKIYLKDGEMNLTCFDGKLTSTLEKGSAIIQLSRITDDSQIILGEGSLSLKISESCQGYSRFRIESNYCDIGKGVDSDILAQDNIIIIDPKIHEENTVHVNCLKGNVSIETVSWQEMLKYVLKK